MTAGSFSTFRFRPPKPLRSEEHTSELQSLCVISYAVFCLKKKKKTEERLIFPGGHAQEQLERAVRGLERVAPVLERLDAFFFFNDTATTEIYTTHNTLSLHDALPISPGCSSAIARASTAAAAPA